MATADQPDGGGEGGGAQEAAQQTVEQVKKKLLDKFKKEAIKKFWTSVIAPNLWWIIPGAIILVMVAILILGIVGMITGGSGGKSQAQKTDPNNPKHMTEIKINAAKTGDQTAASAAAITASGGIMEATSGMLKDATSRGNAETIKKFTELNTMAVSLNTAEPLTSAGFKDLDKVFFGCSGQGSGPAGQDPTCKFALTAEEENVYKPYTTKIRELLSQLNVLASTYTSPSIVMSGKDKYYRDTFQLDIRVIEALDYLTTPVELGGAGFRKIKVRRLRSQYDTNNKRYSNEWDGSDEVTDDSEKAISAHFDGQAMDISGVDMVNRRLYKKSIAKKKITQEAPVDILVVRQSSTGGKTIGNESDYLNSSSLGGMFKGQAASDFMKLLAESTGYNMKDYKPKSGSMAELSGALGFKVLKEETGVDVDPNEDNSTPDKMFTNIGKKTLSDCLDIPANGIVGNTLEEKQANIGREEMAKRFGLPSGSFSGNTSGDIFNSIGKRKIEDIFDLYPGSLDSMQANKEGFTDAVGRITIEQRLGFPRDSMVSNNLATIKSKVGEDKFNEAFKNPGTIDEILNLPVDQKYSDQFRAGNLDVGFYKKAVGNANLEAYYTNFGNYAAVKMDTSDSLSNFGRSYSATPVATGEMLNSADDVWGLPKGTLVKLTQNKFDAFYDIGIYEIPRILTSNDDERFVLQRWFTQFKDQPIENLRYKKSAVDGHIEIKTLEQLRGFSEVAAGLLRANITAMQNNISAIDARLNYAYKDRDIADLKAQIATSEDQLALMGVKAELEEGKNVSNEEDWLVITEDELVSGANLGIASGMIADIFITDNGQKNFYAMGVNKTNYADIKQKDPTKIAENSQARIKFLYDQKNKVEDRIDELNSSKDDIVLGIGTESSLDDINSELATQQRSLKIWDREIAMEETNVAATGASSKDPRAKTQANANAGLKCSGVNVNDTLTNFEEKAKQLGMRKLEQALDLPPGTLSMDLFATKKDYTKAGRKIIEDQFGLKAGTFSGANLDELAKNIGGDKDGLKNFLKIFLPKQNSTVLVGSMPINDFNRNWYKGIFKVNDTLFGIDEESTYDLIAENITPDQYCAKVGKNYMDKTVPDNLSKVLNIDVGGYKLNGEDINAIMSGDFLAAALKIGGKNIDEGLQLPYGTLKAIISNPSMDCRVVVNEASGDSASCIENLLAINGKQKLAQFMGIIGNVGLSDGMSETMGQASFENVLNKLHPTPKLPSGWFNGSSLQTDIPMNLVKTENPDACKPVAKNAPFSFASPDCNAKANDYKTKIVQKLGFDYKTHKLSDLKTTNYNVSGTKEKDITDALDKELNLARGSTAKMLREEITIADYNSKIQKGGAKQNTQDWIVSKLPGDVKEFMQKQNLSVDEIKSYYKIFSDDGKRGMAMGVINSRKNYSEKQLDDPNILGQIVIEDKLGGEPFGWFDEIDAKGLPKTKGLEGVVKNIAYLKGIANPNFAVYDKNSLLNAEKILLAKFGFDPAYHSLSAIKTSAFDPKDTAKNTNPYYITREMDKKLNIREGLTQSLFQGQISVTDYKEKVKKTYINFNAGEIAYTTLLPENVKEDMAKYGLTADDLKNAFNDPDNLRNKALLGVLPGKEIGILMGLGVDIPFIKGDFPDNFTQKVVEETLGLAKGSFSPNSNIGEVVDKNGALKFANSFRINLSADKPDESIAKSFLANNIMQEDKNSFYWNNPLNQNRSRTIDILFKIPINLGESPTKNLLQKKISPKEYLEIVKSYQFAKMEPGQRELYAADFASFMMTGDPESSGTKKRSTLVMGAALKAFTAYKDPSSLKNPAFQVSLLQSLKEVGHIDIDDKLGFQGGTTAKLLLYPQRARSILMGEGMRAVAEKAIFGDQDTNWGLAEDLKDEFFTLFQYYVPGLNPNDYFERPGDANNNAACPVPTKDTQLSDTETKSFIQSGKSWCQHYIGNRLLAGLVEQQTTIKDGDTVVAPGIKLSEKQTNDLIKGDTRVITSMSVAYTISGLRVQQNKDPNDTSLKLIPDGFTVSQEEAFGALYGGDTVKAKASTEASKNYDISWRDQQQLDYDAEWKMAHNGKEPTRTIESGKKYTVQELAQQQEYQNNLKTRIKRPTFWEAISGDQKANAYFSGKRDTIRDAQKEAPKRAKESLQARYFDAQLMVLAQKNDMAPIPVGFTEAMLRGDPELRQDMFLKYGLSSLITSTVFTQMYKDASKDQKLLLDTLKKTTTDALASKNRLDLNNMTRDFQSNFRDSLYSNIDKVLSDKWGVNISGLDFTANLSHYTSSLISTGKGEFLPGNNFQGDARDFAIGKISNIMDKQLGMPSGTSYRGYTMFKAVKTYTDTIKSIRQAQSLVKAYKAGGTAMSLEQLKGMDAAIKTTKDAKALSKTAKTNLKASMIQIGVEILLMVFAEDLAKADANLGLPPGTIAGAISLGVTAYVTHLTGAGPVGLYIAAAFFIYNLIFGFSKVEYQITCPQNTTDTAMNAFYSGNGSPHPMAYINWNSYCKEEDNMHSQWSRINTRNLLYEALIMGEASKNSNLRPTIIGTFRQEDVDYLNGIKEGKRDLVTKIFGPSGMMRGAAGVYKSDYMGDYVHIGY